MLDTYIERGLNSDSNSLPSAHNSCFEVTEKSMNILYEDFLTIGYMQFLPRRQKLLEMNCSGHFLDLFRMVFPQTL